MADQGGVFVLDEPTTGLHLADVEQLLGLLDRPGASHDGGPVVFEGTPAELITARSTLTGEHLAADVVESRATRRTQSGRPTPGDARSGRPL